MKLKTYRAKSMADALVAVKKDLGRGAVILHTRTVRSGGFLGLGRKTIVEVTASDEAPGVGAGRRSGVAGGAGGAEGAGPGIREARRPEAELRAGAGSGERVANRAAAAAYSAAAVGEPAAVTARAAPAAAPVAQVTAAPVVPVVVTSERPPAEPTVMAVRERRVGAGLSVSAAGQDGGLIQRELADIKLLVNQVLQSSAPMVGDGAGCGTMPGTLFQHYLRLLESQVSREIADRLIGRVRDELNAGELQDAGVVRATVLRHLSGLIPGAEAAPVIGRGSGKPFVVALVGPTGVGKTTTIAKLAATYRLRQGRSVGLITADTYRIAAVDQLRTYASIIGLPMKVVMSPAEMGAAVEAMSSHDVVLIDTAGRSQRNAERLTELAAFLDAAKPSETHLVLSTAAAQEVLIDAAEAFSVLKPNRVILTKLDEAVHFGAVVNVMQRLQTQLSFVTTGQEVPDHIEPGRPERLARLILGGEIGAGASGGGVGRVTSSGAGLVIDAPGWRADAGAVA